MRRRRRAFLLALIAAAPACRAVETNYAYPADLDHPNYVRRTKAVREFVERQDAAQLPRAFDLLLDSQPYIRAMAYRTIRSLSRDGRDFGYRPYLEETVRRGIVARWRSWWEAGQPAPEAAGPEGIGG
ncbi:MAG: hypothetical protein ACREID_08940 [Planctomycetota bacterium]